MSQPFRKRRQKVLRELNKRNLDSLLVASPANWFYLTGFTGESGLLVVTRDGTTLFTDGRFTTQAREEAQGVRVLLQKGSLFAAVGEWQKL